ncbi:MAG: hypothetical protein EOO36_24090, partial [Cytophagaceae bacterium]
MNPLARPFFRYRWLLLVVLAGLLGTAAPAMGQNPRLAASADSLRLLQEEAHPPVLVPVVAPTDTLVYIGACPNAGPRARIMAIIFVGNAKTKERILRAELNIREGDTLALADLPARLEANRRRVYNLQLFHAVLVQATCGGSGQVTILFSVQERWYVLPTPIFSIADPNFKRWLDRPGAERWQRLDYGLHLTHTNFR